MTVEENIKIAEQMHHRYGFFDMLFSTGKFRNQENAMRENAKKYLDMVGITRYANQRADNLSYGHQKMLEIARCLATDPKILLLDEPAAGMNPNESLQLVEDIKRIHAETNITIILVEHDMKVVMGLCEYIYAMASGKIIASGTPDEISHDQAVIEAYLGGERKDA